MIETYYVYCHDCKKLLFKGAKDDAMKINCGKHGITFGTLEYINRTQPKLNTSRWNFGILKVVKGDATVPQLDTPYEIAMIPHVCNDIGGWGAGFVLALSAKWEKPERLYRNYLESHGKLPVLGLTCFAKINNSIVVANMIAQHAYISAKNPIPLKYKALVNCMADVVEYIKMIQSQTVNPVVIHTCRFGSDLAGGDWNFILELIREIWLENGINVVVYEYEPDETKWSSVL